MPPHAFAPSALLRTATLVAAVGFIVLFAVVALLRISYPYELEWMEGSMVDHVQRVLDGKPLYAAPTLEHVAFGYTPLYYWAAAGVSRLLGVTGFLPLRLISLLAAFGCFLLVYLIVKRETGRREYAFIAAGLLAATYQDVGFWFDIGRVDSLFLLLALGAMYVMRRFRTALAWTAAGLLLTLALLTKQVGIVVAAPLLLWGWLTDRRLAPWATGTFVLSTVIALALLVRAHPYWFWYYAFVQPARHHLVPFQFFYFLLQDLPMTLGVALLAVLFWLALLRGAVREKLLLLLFVSGLVAATLLPRVKAGGGDNDLIPVYAGLAILFGVALQQIIAWLRGVAPDPGHGVVRDRLLPFVYLACLVQFAALVYNPKSPVPSAQDRAAGDQLLQTMRAVPGEVFLICHGYLPRLAGKTPQANSIAITDVVAAGVPGVRRQMLSAIRTAVEEQRYGAIILDVWEPLLWDEIDLNRYYVRRGDVFDDHDHFWPRSGWQTRPEWIYVPRPGAEPPAPSQAEVHPASGSVPALPFSASFFTLPRGLPWPEGGL